MDHQEVETILCQLEAMLAKEGALHLNLDAHRARLAHQLAEVQALAQRIDAHCDHIEAMLDRGELYWSWRDRRLHWRREEKQ